MQNFIVYGHCDKGIKFRPSDWTERLVNAHTVTQQSKQCVHVFNINGIKGIKGTVENKNPKNNQKTLYL